MQAEFKLFTQTMREAQGTAHSAQAQGMAQRRPRYGP